MHLLVDYRPALTRRTGVGEYAHELAAALARTGRPDDRLTLFTSSWRDRPDPALRQWPGVEVVDCRVPVRLLNWAWHRRQWPPIEWLAGPVDVAVSMHPLLLPARDALQVVTVYDLDFLRHPERTTAEIRRDYPALVRDHARRAALVVVISVDTARAVQSELLVPADRIVLCRPGLPGWIGQPIARPRTCPRLRVVCGDARTAQEHRDAARRMDAARQARAEPAKAPAGRRCAAGGRDLDRPAAGAAAGRHGRVRRLHSRCGSARHVHRGPSAGAPLVARGLRPARARGDGPGGAGGGLQSRRPARGRRRRRNAGGARRRARAGLSDRSRAVGSGPGLRDEPAGPGARGVVHVGHGGSGPARGGRLG